MKKALLVLFMLFCGLVAFGQTAVVFDGTQFPANLTPWGWGQSTIDLDPGAGPGGTNAIKWVQGDEWGGGWSGIGFTVDPPFTLADVWEKGKITITMRCDPGTDSMRIQYESGPSPAKLGMVFHPIADSQWHKYTFALKELAYQDGTSGFDATDVRTVGIMAEASAKVGKVVHITNWFVTTGPSLIMFNGVAIPSNMELWSWGSTSAEVVPGAGPVAGSNALKWNQGDGAMGIGFTVTPPADLGETWTTDSVKFKMKADAGVDTMTFLLYSISNQIVNGINIVPITDGQWHDYALPLRSLVPQRGSTGFDSTNIPYVELSSGEFAGGGVAGKAVYLTDWWTGNPVFDVKPPDPPTALAVAPGSFSNLVTWSDVQGENGERYNVYYSTSPITDVTLADVVKLKVKDNVQEAEHPLFAPATDQQVSYYYAVTCTDASGNVSTPAPFGPIVNTAKGVATISLQPPATFVADGDLNEWSGIAPFHRTGTDGSQYVVSWGEPFKNAADLTFDAYIAVDKTYLYVAFDVEDDVVNYTSEATNHQDSPDFHIGLYNWHGAPHTGFKRGDQPDYLIRFAKSRALIDLISNGDSLLVPGQDYFWGERFPSGYTIEARIPWTRLAAMAGDSVFEPVEGYRIPIDIMFNDADTTGDRESMLHLSPYSDGNSWADPSVWVYTWIGNSWAPLGVEEEYTGINAYALAQNYPNPFNPTTRIGYTLQKPGLVTINIYDLLGRLVTTIVNEQQSSGPHVVGFNGSGLASGVYMYRITSGSFSSTRKMILMK